VERRLSTNLLQLLNLADQARLEGRRGSDNSAAAIDAATVLIRIAYRFQVIARERLLGSKVTPPQNIRELCTVLESRYCAVLEYELQKLKSIGRPQQSSSTAPTMPTIELAPMNEAVTAELAESADLSAYIHSNLVPQIESYRRLPVLLRRLDMALSKIAIY
ncbi:MAG: hypothetical protein JOZ29_04210, partial [Deltaproteobacteria bacterium]|nr:hypothetical protein [Deltaproteobacteria bacterium]